MSLKDVDDMVTAFRLREESLGPPSSYRTELNEIWIAIAELVQVLAAMPHAEDSRDLEEELRDLSGTDTSDG